jgi:hypothetical protein
MVAARGMDLFSTRLVSPDLVGEQNPLSLWWGAGWPVLIGVNAAVLLVTIPAFAFATWRTPALRPPPAPMREFILACFSSPPRPWTALLFRLPSRGRRIWYFGRWMPWVILLTSALAVAGNLLSRTDSLARFLWHQMIGTTPALVSTVTVLVIVSWSAWMFAERAAARRSHPIPSQAPSF